MRIEKIRVQNYRQLRDVTIDFPAAPENDLHVFIGKNTTGKTNILNALNWCLYGDEPHLNEPSQAMPRLNARIQKEEVGKDAEIRVEVWTTTDDGKKVMFTRSEKVRIQTERDAPTLKSVSFSVTAPGEGGAKILVDEEADAFVERFVPRGIRQFFFFDGERLHNYFKEATGKKVREAVFEISQVKLLENVIDHLTRTTKMLRSEAGKLNPSTELTEQEWHQAEDALAEVKARIETTKGQIDEANKNLVTIEGHIKDTPDIAEYERQRDVLKREISKKEAVRDERSAEKRELLSSYGTLLGLKPAIVHSLDVIQDKRSKNEIPPAINTILLRDVLKAGRCHVCDRELDKKARSHVERLAGELEKPTNTALVLHEMETPLHLCLEHLTRYDEDIDRIARECSVLSKELLMADVKLKNLDKKVAGLNIQDVAYWQEQRVKWEGNLADNRARLAGFVSDQEQAERKVAETKERLDRELNKSGKARELKHQIDFGDRALAIADESKQSIMHKVRDEIERETDQLLKQLLWRTQSYGKVEIDDDYSIRLVNKVGQNCLGTLSAAEFALLALSFTLALHRVSGFDSPLLIDTPVARMEGEHRENFAKVLATVGRRKQVILLFTPSEYRDEIKAPLDKAAETIRTLKLSGDEKTSQIEVTKHA